MSKATPTITTIWTPPSRVPAVVLPPSRVPRVHLPNAPAPDLTEHVRIDLLSDAPATVERFHMVGFKWEPGDEAITWIDEEIP